MNQYILPFKRGDKILELGGGNDPIYRPNFDIRQLKNVDKVIDFNKPLPIPNRSYNGIYSRFVLEHLSWRTNKLFLSEIYRILIPGGLAVIITSNLLEQVKILANNPNWSDKQLSLLFGDQRLDPTKEFDEDWDFNAHHSGYHPEYITKTLKDIGFQKINILSIVTEQGPIDMIIECTKPDIQIIDTIFKEIPVEQNHTGPIIQNHTGPIIQNQTGPIIQNQTGPIIQNQTGPIIQNQTGPIITKGKLPEEYINYDDKSTIESKQKKQYKFSIVYPTYRPGSMELLFSSLSKQTYKNFELILIDDYPPRTNNKQELYDHLPNKEIPKYLKFHDPPKPDCYNKFYKYGTAVNTGLIETAKSEFNADIIIFLQDYTYIPPNHLEKWNDAFNETGIDTIITGTATIISTPNPTKWNDHFSIWDQNITESILNVKSEEEFKNIPGFNYHSQWNPIEYEGFYTGIPKDIIIKLNGLDENIDYHCEQANSFFERAKIAGYKLIVKKELNCYIVDHRIWHPPNKEEDYLWHANRFETLRKDKKPIRYPLEYYVQQVKDGKTPIKANNCFDLEQIYKYKGTTKDAFVPIISDNAYAERAKFIVNNAIKCKDKILNIGCANDCFPFTNFNANLDILHVDIVDQIFIESIKSKVKFQKVDAHSLPFNDKEYNCCILGDILEHVKNPVQVLNESKRVGKNVYITVPNEWKWDKALNPFQNPGHIRYYTYDSLVKDLDDGLGKDSYNIVQYDGGGWSFWTISYEAADNNTDIHHNAIIDLPNKNRKLRIALLSSPFFGTPPAKYGGLEAVVWDLAEGLDKLGHIVTLFAPEGSRKPEHGYLITTGPALDTVGIDWFQAEKNNYEIYKQYITSDKFDIVDSHTWFGFEYLLRSKDPNLKIIHTMHGGLSWDSPPNW